MVRKQTTGVLYAHTDAEAGTEKLISHLLKQPIMENYQFKMEQNKVHLFEDQDENPNSSIAASEYKWVVL